MKGYSPTGETLTQFDLSKLMPDQALVVTTIGRVILHVSVPAIAKHIFAGNRVCLTSALVDTWNDLLGLNTGVVNAIQPSRVVMIGEFWQYDTDQISHRVRSIELYVKQ